MTTTGRRALLTAGASAAAAALTGCTSDGAGPRRPSPAEEAAAREAERVARAEAALRRRAADASRTLLERYDAALAAHPALRTRVAPLRAAAAAHVRALSEGDRPAPSPSAASGTAAPAASTAPAAPRPAPADPAAALRELAAAARTASGAHTAELLAAPPEYARLLASVAAAGAAHAYLLTEGARA
ncbi:hypothetical protein [Streptomyces filamentosus]|uniref:hypothetical protein n=1 Tax=Streptomyces filamentosus TaxID=67294 RepID=UPI001239BC53|nr:hypothetical protein [Streptomyces filamentosus]KAA6219941.1 hypothetical protein CP979_25880 [Streptomyces filamentosus]